MGSLAVLVAAWNGNLEALRVLLDEGGEVVDIDVIPEAENPDWALKKEWRAALHGAAAKGEMACVEFLLSRGARTDIRNGAGLTPEQTAENSCPATRLHVPPHPPLPVTHRAGQAYIFSRISDGLKYEKRRRKTVVQQTSMVFPKQKSGRRLTLPRQTLIFNTREE
ncbi:hypothetical protein FJTKL_05085 [Diaporthe vaccinii]|uniref:Ankyrin repeat protein n=1 Tax=Diaporthe vaccinii TaxID=105482 RepID=A0ABR4EZK2_9PEZI